MFSSKDLFFTPAAGGFTVSKSLRFRASANAYLGRTTGTSTDVKKVTISMWVKPSLISTNASWLYHVNGSNASGIFIDNTNGAAYGAYKLIIRYSIASGATVYYCASNLVMRDPSAWYHLVVVQDTAASTGNRIKAYLNGVAVTFGTYNEPALNETSGGFNPSSVGVNIGSYDRTSSGYFYDGYLAEVNFIDGQALDQTYFGAYDTNGIWQPKAYSGSGYGTNGFYLKFTDVGTTTAGGANTGYGKDFAGTNNWTTNNFGTTSTAVTYDSMLDSPTNATGDIGNYAVVNPIAHPTTFIAPTDGNLSQNCNTAAWTLCVATLQIPNGSGLWQWELVQTGTANGANAFGVALSTVQANVTGDPGSRAGCSGVNNSSGAFINGATSGSITYPTVGNTVTCLYDATNLTFQVFDNGTSKGTITGLPSGDVQPFVAASSSNGSPTFVLNFGQRPFAYDKGGKALNTQNLTTPTITNGAQYMAAVTYSGATAPNTVTATSTNSGNNPNAVTFQPDLVWIKARSAATNHKLTDVARGTTKALSSNLASAETTDTNGLTAFTSSGFTVGSDTNYNNTTGPVTYVAWEWKAASGTSTVPSGGTITPTAASLNTAAGFSIIAYTGNGTSGATVPHGLGVTPNMVIVKGRDNTNSWMVKHSSTTTNTNLFLSDTSANYTTPPSGYISDLSSSSTVTLTAGSAGIQNVNTNAEKYIMYSWAAIANYSAFSSYTGNGSSDGPVIYTGFRPRFVMIKGTGTATSWLMVDSARNNNNVVNNHLGANLAEIENGASLGNNTNQLIDFLSNGFKIRMTNSDMNNSGANYIYMAFAENPFKIARAY